MHQLRLKQERLEFAQKEKEMFKKMFEKNEEELANLTNTENRLNAMDDLKNSY